MPKIIVGVSFMRGIFMESSIANRELIPPSYNKRHNFNSVSHLKDKQIEILHGPIFKKYLRIDLKKYIGKIPIINRGWVNALCNNAKITKTFLLPWSWECKGTYLSSNFNELP